MSKRATEAAMKALPNYPPEIYADENEYIEVESERSMQRVFYRKGYEQAEKDLALTWEDAKKIDDLFMGVATLFAMVGRNEDILEQPYYEEVAKRFNEQRKK